MKHVLRGYIILIFQAILFLFNMSAFAQQPDISMGPVEVLESEMALYKGVIPGHISAIDEKSGSITLFQEHEGQGFSIDRPVHTISKHYMIKIGYPVQSLLAKGTSGYDERMNIITDTENIKKALSYGTYDSMPEDPEEAATLEEVKPIAIKDKK